MCPIHIRFQAQKPQVLVIPSSRLVQITIWCYELVLLFTENTIFYQVNLTYTYWQQVPNKVNVNLVDTCIRPKLYSNKVIFKPMNFKTSKLKNHMYVLSFKNNLNFFLINIIIHLVIHHQKMTYFHQLFLHENFGFLTIESSQILTDVY